MNVQTHMVWLRQENVEDSLETAKRWAGHQYMKFFQDGDIKSNKSVLQG